MRKTFRERLGAVDPRAPLALGEVAVEVQVNPLRGEACDILGMKADAAARNDGVELPVDARKPRGGRLDEPIALRQIAGMG